MTKENSKLKELLEWVNKQEKGIGSEFKSGYLNAMADVYVKIQDFLLPLPLQVKLIEWQEGDRIIPRKSTYFHQLYGENIFHVIKIDYVIALSKCDIFNEYIELDQVINFTNIDAEIRIKDAEIAHLKNKLSKKSGS